MFNLGYNPVIVLIISFCGDFNFVLAVVRRNEKFLDPIYANVL